MKVLVAVLLFALFLSAQTGTVVVGGGSSSGGTVGPQGPAGPKGDKGDTGNQGPEGLLPAGFIAFLDAGSCPTGWTEVAQGGKYILLTQAASADVGGSATSSLSLTAAAQSFTGDATTVPAQTFTGDATTVPALSAGTLAHSHTHPVTMVTYQVANSTTTAKYAPTTLGGTSLASGTTSINTGAVSSSAVTGSTATGSLTPQGHNTANSITPIGHNASSAVTGTATPAYIKLIACKKT